MELKKRNLSDNGIRLKPNKPNLLENYLKNITSIINKI